MNCAAVASTAFSQAGQAVLDASSSVEDLSDVTSKGSGSIITTSERTRVGWVDVTSSVQGFVDDRQTTAAADVKYRLKTDSLSKTDAETADGQRVLVSVFDSAIGARQTTVAQEATYRKIANSYSQSQVYTQSAADAEFYNRSTLDTEFDTKQDSLDANGALVVAAHPYVTADKDKVAYIDTSELLSTSLAAKQGNLDANGLLVVAAHPYVTADKNKVAFIDTGVLLSTSLATKQATIGDGDLTIGQTSNLQTALDARQTTVAQEAAYRKIADSYTETEVNSALLLKAAVDNPTFTTKITTPELHCSNLMSQNSHLQLGSQHTNDVNIYLNGQETLQITEVVPRFDTLLMVVQAAIGSIKMLRVMRIWK